MFFLYATSGGILIAQINSIFERDLPQAIARLWATAGQTAIISVHRGPNLVSTLTPDAPTPPKYRPLCKDASSPLLSNRAL